MKSPVCKGPENTSDPRGLKWLTLTTLREPLLELKGTYSTIIMIQQSYIWEQFSENTDCVPFFNNDVPIHSVCKY